jgi:translation initiation factor IF-2
LTEDKNLSREGNSEDPGKKAAADAARKKPAGKPDESAAKPKKKKNIIIVTGGNSASKGGRQGNSRGNYSSGTGRYDNAGGGRDAGRDGRPRQQKSGSQAPGKDGAGRPADRKPRQGAAQDRNQAAAGRRNQGGSLEAQRQYRPIRPTVVPTVMEVDFHKEPAPVKAAPRPEAKAPEKEAPVPAPVQEAPVPAPVQEAPAPAAAPAAEAPAPAPEKEAPVREEPVRAQAPETRTAESAAPAPEAQDRQKTERPAGRDQKDGRPAGREGFSRDGRPAREGRQGTDRPFGRDGAPRQGGDRPFGRDSAPRQGGDRPFGRDGAPRQGGDRPFGRDGAPRQGTAPGFNRDNRDSRQTRGARPGQAGGFRPQGQGQTGDRQRAPFGQGRPGAPAADRTGAGRRPAGGGRSAAPADGSFVRDPEKHRDENKRKMNKERDNRSRKDLIYSDDKENQKNKPGRFIRPEKKAEDKVEEQIKTITIPDKLSIRDLAERMHLQPAELIKKLFLSGKVMTVNSEVSFEEAEAIAMDYDILCEKEEVVDVIEELLKEDEEEEETMMTRPPVVCVMGHVDHGKTSLLDKIRSTNVTRGEAGGITQAIGAYTVKINGQVITFLDTPGHEAFTAMRMRGASSTDIAVLVVAADDGVMPQTIEAINHAKAAGVEIIVAVNKIDKPDANVEKVKQEMTNYELVATDWGGSTEFVPVSAKTGEGIEDLLETILLTAEMLELKANPDRLARGLVLEAKLDKGRGPVANVLVQKGTLHVGDFISAGACSGKVRAMIDDKGRRVKEAGPSYPVEILGLSDVPSAGEVFLAHPDNETAKTYAEAYKNQHKEELLEETRMRMNLDDLFNQMKEGTLKEFDLIIKADVQGSVEALKASLLKLSNDEVIVKVIHSGVGQITESDVQLAIASNAVIIGFNVRPDATAKSMADHEGVDIRLYKVIYQAIDAIELALKGMRAPVYEERVIGHAEVRALFKASAVGNIAGSYVLDGIVRSGCRVRLSRGEELIYDGSLASLKRFKDDVKEVRAGFECGLVFKDFDKMQVGDVMECFDLVEVPRE